MAREASLTRRDFLKRAALLGAGAGLASLAACTPAAAPTKAPEVAPTTVPAGETAPTAAPPQPAGEKVTIRYMFWESIQEPAVKEQIAAFAAVAPEVTVEPQLVAWEQYWDKLWTALAGGGAPDTFWLNMHNFTALAPKGALLNIQPYLDKEAALKQDWEENYDSLKEAYSFDKQAYSWPRDYDTIATILNLKLLGEAGLSYPDEADEFKAWDWAAFRSYAEKLTKVVDGRTEQYGVLAINWDQGGWFNWIYSNGGTILNADKTKCTINEPAAIEALREYTSYRRNGWAPGAEVLETQDTTEMLATGKIGMSIDGDWMLSDFVNRFTDFEWDVAPIPYAPTGMSKCMIHGLGNTIDKAAKVPDAAFKWVSFLGSKDGSSILGKAGVVIPSRKDTAPLFFDPSFKPKHRRVYLDWTPKAVFFPNTAKPATGEWTKVIEDQLTEVMEQGKDVQQAMDEAAQKVDELLAGQGA